MKVYKISHADMGSGYVTPNYQDFKVELEIELDEYSLEAGYTREDIDPFIESLAKLKVGEGASLGPWDISCLEISEEEFNQLPEFPGW